MTDAEVERFLEKAWDADELIKAKRQQLAELTANVTSITASLTGMPSAAKDPHKKFDTYAILVDSIYDDINELIGIQKKITDIISSVKDDRIQLLLIERYLNHKTWEKIAGSLNVSPDSNHIYVLRKKALKIVKEYIESH